MIPQSTRYFLAVTDADYQTAATFLEAQGQPDAGMRYPTVLAERHDHLIGVLGTTPVERWPAPFNTMVVVGPLVVSRALERPIIVVMRLIEIYEILLRQAGVRGVLWATDRQDPRWTDLLSSLGLTPYGYTPEHDWYVWHLDQSWVRLQKASA